VHDVIAGLGGRAITAAALRGLFTQSELDELTFLDLDRALLAGRI
jgi:pyruvate ferredoxin oxidoreductase alpha subunit